MEIIAHHFCNSLGYKTHTQHEIKKIVTTGVLKRKTWMADDEFDFIVKNSQTVLELNAEYQNHLYVQESTKECSIMFIYETYILEGEAGAKFSLGDIWNLFQKDLLPNNIRNF